MVKKSVVILGILATLVISAGMSWGYTVSQWPVPGIPNTTWGGSSCLVSPQDFTLRGPVAPSCTPSLFAGVLHAGIGAPFRLMAAGLNPLFGIRRDGRRGGCCNVELDGPAFVTAAVPCTAVQRFVPPCGF